VAADAERGCREGELDGFFGGWGMGHERSAGESSGVVQLEDGAIDTGGQTEVVGVEDETAHGVSVSTRGARGAGTAEGQERCYDGSRPQWSFPHRVGG